MLRIDPFLPFLRGVGRLVPRPFAWLKNVISGDGDQRVHALCSLMACGTLCAATIMLTRAACAGKQVAVELGATLAALGVYSGTVYVRGKMSEDKRIPPDSPSDPSQEKP